MPFPRRHTRNTSNCASNEQTQEIIFCIIIDGETGWEAGSVCARNACFGHLALQHIQAGRNGGFHNMELLPGWLVYGKQTENATRI